MPGQSRARRGPSDDVLVEARAAGLTLSAIAQRYGGSERTIRRRCATPEMRRRIADRHAEVADAIVGQLGALLGCAVEAIDHALANGLIGERLRAAALLFEHFERLRRDVDVHREIVEHRIELDDLRAAMVEGRPPQRVEELR